MSDRAIIDESVSAGSTLISVTLAAMAMNKNVILQVDGCIKLTAGEATTAPKITKIHLFNQ
ncbi:MAG: hypothetical protein HRT35_31840 [Algicola sp.]|nr:hypothetical protein [Algicola sp.]